MRGGRKPGSGNMLQQGQVAGEAGIERVSFLCLEGGQLQNKPAWPRLAHAGVHLVGTQACAAVKHGPTCQSFHFPPSLATVRLQWCACCRWCSQACWRRLSTCRLAPSHATPGTSLQCWCWPHACRPCGESCPGSTSAVRPGPALSFPILCCLLGTRNCGSLQSCTQSSPSCAAGASMSRAPPPTTATCTSCQSCPCCACPSHLGT